MRDMAIDVARGLTFLEMIAVSGNSCLGHAPIGAFSLSYADTIFPSFAFISGAVNATPVSSLRLIGLGLAYNAISDGKLSPLRPFGVLQRLGLARLLAGLSPPADTWQGLLYIPITIGTWIYASIWSAKDRHHPFKNPSRSTQTRIDRAFVESCSTQPLKLRLYRDEYDPEGLLGSIMMSASVWFGRWCIVNKLAPDESLITGVSLFSLGFMFSYAFPRTCPLSKPYWSLSYALITSGLSLLKLTAVRAITPLLPGQIKLAFSAVGQYSLQLYFAALLLEKTGMFKSLKQLLLRYTSSTWTAELGCAVVKMGVISGMAVLWKSIKL